MSSDKHCSCPYCNAIFRLPEEKFKHRAGIVRCGACREIFDSKANRIAKTQHGFVHVSEDFESFENWDNSVVMDNSDNSDNLKESLGSNSQSKSNSAPGVEEPESDSFNSQSVQQSVTKDKAFTHESDLTHDIDSFNYMEDISIENDEDEITVSMDAPTRDSSLSEIVSHSLSHKTDHEIDHDVGYDIDEQRIPERQNSQLDIASTRSGLFADKAEYSDEQINNPFEDASYEQTHDNLKVLDSQDDSTGENPVIEPSISPLDFDPDNSISLEMDASMDDTTSPESLSDDFKRQDNMSLRLDDEANSMNNNAVSDSALYEPQFKNSIPSNGEVEVPTLVLPSQPNLEDSSLSRMTRDGVDEYIKDRANPLASFTWLMVAAGFLFLLSMQIKYFYVEKYAQDDNYRKYLAGFCMIAQCELPARSDPYSFTLTHTKIDLHPAQPGALRVTVKLVNEAGYPQPYPSLQLTLTDRVGRVVGRRSFSPEDYLLESSQNLVGDGELGTVLFDLARPHEKAVGFVIDIVTDENSV